MQGLAPATTYSFRVRALSAELAAIGWSSAVSFTTPAKCPEGLVRANSTDGGQCVACGPGMVAYEGAYCQPKTATIGVLLPYTDARDGAQLAGSSWKHMVCAAQLAVAHVNSGREGVVPGLTGIVSNLTSLTARIYDSGDSATSAMLAYRQFRADGGTGVSASRVVERASCTSGEELLLTCSYFCSRGRGRMGACARQPHSQGLHSSTNACMRAYTT